MDISSEINEINSASRGGEIRAPIVQALNKLNDGTLPSVSASDAGKQLLVGTDGDWQVGDSGLSPAPTGSISITQNGTYNVTQKAQAVVNVSGGGGGSVLIPKTITENGTYDSVDDNADGYSSVTIIVPENHFIEPLQYLLNTNYYPAIGYEYYNCDPIETSASFFLNVGSYYCLSLTDNSDIRFRRAQFDVEPFTIIPSEIPTPGSGNYVQVQQGINIDRSLFGNTLVSSEFSSGLAARWASVIFLAQKPYLAVHLSKDGNTPDVMLFKY